MNNGGCGQNCNNTPGSYMCSCYEGYSLNFDLFNCSGKQIIYTVAIYLCSMFNKFNGHSTTINETQTNCEI